VTFENPYTGHVFEAATVTSPLSLGSAQASQ